MKIQSYLPTDWSATMSDEQAIDFVLAQRKELPVSAKRIDTSKQKGETDLAYAKRVVALETEIEAQEKADIERKFLAGTIREENNAITAAVWEWVNGKITAELSPERQVKALEFLNSLYDRMKPTEMLELIEKFNGLFV